MPGLVGLVTRMPRVRAEPELARMVDTLRHDPSYEIGTFIDESLGVYLGWIARRRSFADGMPLRTEQGDGVLVFSGEEYPEPGIAGRLKTRGHTLEEDGPSYLVHLSEEDPAFPAGLNGRFHGLLVDRARGTATLFNDRYGIHRLYLHEGREALYFAAEAKAILDVRPELRTPDVQGLGELIACGSVLENRTLFAGIRVLPPASAWVFRDGALERRGRYFHPREWEDQPLLEPEACYQAIRHTFSENLPRYFSGNERIGMSLTGGLDTRMIMAWHQSPPGSLPCYSFGGTFRDSHDVVIARRVAGVCGQPHEVIPVGGDFLARFSQYAERTVFLSDGCAGVNHAADLYVNERARTIAPVRMTGNYGSEVLRRVRAFKPVEPAAGLFQPELMSHIRAANEVYAGFARAHPLSFAVFQQLPWHHQGLLGLEQTEVTVRSPYLDNDLVRTVFRAPAPVFADASACLRLIGDGKSALRDIPTDRGLGGNQGRLAATLSRRLRELSFKAEYACDYGMPQWLAPIDRLLSPFRPERLFLGRHKFAHFRIWYRDALAPYVKDMLLDPRTLSRPYLQPRTVETIVRRHLHGDRNYTSAIHKVLTLELIHRLFLDAPHSRRSHGAPAGG